MNTNQEKYSEKKKFKYIYIYIYIRYRKIKSNVIQSKDKREIDTTRARIVSFFFRSHVQVCVCVCVGSKVREVFIKSNSIQSCRYSLFFCCLKHSDTLTLSAKKYTIITHVDTQVTDHRWWEESEGRGRSQEFE